MSERSRCALILKLSRQNLEVHNVDQSIWTIQEALSAPQGSTSQSDKSELQNLGIGQGKQISLKEVT